MHIYDHHAQSLILILTAAKVGSLVTHTHTQMHTHNKQTHTHT